MTTHGQPWFAALAAVMVSCSSSPRLETRTFQLNHLSPGEASSIIDPYVFTDRPDAPGRLSRGTTSITVRETPDNLERIARVLAEFDRRQPGVRLKFKIIEADGVAVRDSAIADIEAVLRSLFRFRGYRLVTEAVLTGTQGAEASQPLSGPGTRYMLETRIRRLGGGDSATVDLWVRLYMTDRSGTGRFETDVRLPLGKTAVLGSAQASGGQGATILAVQPELLTN